MLPEGIPSHLGVRRCTLFDPGQAWEFSRADSRNMLHTRERTKKKREFSGTSIVCPRNYKPENKFAALTGELKESLQEHRKFSRALSDLSVLSLRL